MKVSAKVTRVVVTSLGARHSVARRRVAPISWLLKEDAPRSGAPPAFAHAAAFLAALALPSIALAQSQPPSPAVEEFAESAGAVIFAAGQMIIEARVCGGDEKVGRDIRKLMTERARQCAAADPRVAEVADHMDAAFDAMLKNADTTIARRGKDAICTLYRSPDLQVEVATALQMGQQLATDAGRDRVRQLPCPPKD